MFKILFCYQSTYWTYLFGVHVEKGVAPNVKSSVWSRTPLKGVEPLRAERSRVGESTTLFLKKYNFWLREIHFTFHNWEGWGRAQQNYFCNSHKYILQFVQIYILQFRGAEAENTIQTTCRNVEVVPHFFTVQCIEHCPRRLSGFVC